ncbi:hypothetical protein PUN28_020771 [Cardiocondyla obscurior]|uniref:Uncharacterized protein n=1 Tax=Cardiocondyla obscurior TaxID=286306 RepID=A0AAW2E579_9HYME
MWKVNADKIATKIGTEITGKNTSKFSHLMHGNNIMRQKQKKNQVEITNKRKKLKKEKSRKAKKIKKEDFCNQTV